MEQEEREEEKRALETLLVLEDLAEKKIKIFSRLLMDTALAKQMEELSLRHEQSKEELAVFLGRKPKKKTEAQKSGEEEQ